jgi:hypothetical protein
MGETRMNNRLAMFGRRLSAKQKGRSSERHSLLTPKWGDFSGSSLPESGTFARTFPRTCKSEYLG